MTAKGMPEDNSHNAEWQSGIEYEMEFWRGWIKERGGAWSEDFERRVRGETTFQQQDLLSQLDAPVVKVLDVGAGPISVLGPIWPGVDLEIVAVDPLADEYDRILDEAGIRPPVRTLAGSAERLDLQFAPNTFDMVHCCNALDHSLDAMLGIYKMLHVVKVGKPVMLTHNNREADQESYSGFHQWNFDIVAGEFKIWRTDIEFNVSDILSEFADVEVRSSDERAHTVIIWKRLELPEYLLSSGVDTSVLDSAEVKRAYLSTLEQRVLEQAHQQPTNSLAQGGDLQAELQRANDYVRELVAYRDELVREVETQRQAISSQSQFEGELIAYRDELQHQIGVMNTALADNADLIRRLNSERDAVVAQHEVASELLTAREREVDELLADRAGLRRKLEKCAPAADGAFHNDMSKGGTRFQLTPSSGAPRLQVIRMVPNAGFSMTQEALEKVGRGEIIENLHNPSEVRAASRPLHVIPASGTWNFFPTSDSIGALAMLDEAFNEYGSFDGITVVFDCAGEGFHFSTDVHKAIVDRLERYRIPKERAVLMTSRLNAEQEYLEWCSAVSQPAVLTALSTPVQLYYYSGVYRTTLDGDFSSRLISQRWPFIERPRPKKFICQNFMPREARWASVLTFLDEGVLEDGVVSFHGAFATAAAQECSTDLVDVASSLRRLGLSDAVIGRLDELNQRLPMLIEEDNSSRFEKAYGVADQPYWAQVYFSVVTESDFYGYAGHRFTEKVLKPIANLLPFVIIGTPGSLAELRRLGFQTFGGLIDESYDDIADPAERFRAAIGEAVRLAKMDHDALHRLYGDLWPRLVHNLMHFSAVAGRLVDFDEAYKYLNANAGSRPATE